MDATHLRVGFVTVVALLSATAGASITWGQYSARLEVLERQQQAEMIESQKHEVLLAQNDVQFREIIRRLSRIEDSLSK